MKKTVSLFSQLAKCPSLQEIKKKTSVPSPFHNFVNMEI